ncbi:MAG: hypothetical protein MJ058_02870 [Akkermansia sp.]|nr:hypothetical protein [Akkermansia sp.]
MNNHITGISVLAAMALTVPCVCHAQDPVSALKQVQDLAAAGKVQDAVELCDKILTKFGDPNSTIAKQFRWVLPFYAWEKADTLYKAADYDGAYKAYKAYADNKMFTEKTFLDAVKLNAPQQYEVFEARRTYAVFQQGLSLYMLGSGTEEAAGDKTKLEAAIPLLEEYYNMLQKNKVSALEKKQKLDGRVCFMLVQAYMLQPTPDFKKAGEYLEKARKAKGKLPDDMAMTGLNTVARIAMEHPETAGWVYKIISTSPASYNMDPARAARYADKYLNNGIKATMAADKAMKANDVASAAEAAHSANCLFGLVPDMVTIRTALAAQNKAIGKSAKAFTDSGTGVRMVPEHPKKLTEAYKKLEGDHRDLDGYAVLSTANMALTMQSSRLAKAGYQILVDRYKDLVQTDKDNKTVEMLNNNYFQLAQLCYATGDQETGDKYIEKVQGQGDELGGDKAKNIAVNKMGRLLKDKDWEGVIPASEEVMKLFQDDVTNQYYVSAQFAIIAALHNLKNYEEVVKKAEELLHSGGLEASGKSALKPDKAKYYNITTFYYLMDSHMKLASLDGKHLDQAMEVFKRYKERNPEYDLKENALSPNMHYAAVEALTRMARQAEEAEAAKLNQQALAYCKTIVEQWPDGDFAPNADLQAAAILIADPDQTVKPEAIKILERCADNAKKRMDEKGAKQDIVFSNALFWLDSYGPEIPLEGEDEAAVAKRVQGYNERFWNEADYEGCVYSLPAACLRVSRADKENNAETFKTALDGLRSIIVREANCAYKSGKTNPELEKAINTYIDKYTAGAAKYQDAIPAKDTKALLQDFSEISPDDKYTNAILRMALINAMNQEMASIKDDPAKRDAMALEVEREFRDMTNTFKPDDLTSFIAVQVGDYLVKYVSRFDDPSTKQNEIDTAISYYDSVINRRRDRVAEATLGKANALAFSKNPEQQKEAIKLYEQVSSGPVTTQTIPAMEGLAELYSRNGNYEKARDAAALYLKSTRGNNKERLQMMMLLGKAYDQCGDIKNALLTYMNVFNQNRNQISFSAPACVAAMELFWKRNTPSSGDRIKGNFKASDRWTAWSTGQNYVNLIKRSKLEDKMTASDRDAYNKVVAKVAEYSADAAVQREDKEGKDFQRKLENN